MSTPAKEILVSRPWITTCKYGFGGGFVLLVLYGMSLYSYVLFHSFVELFSVAVAVGSFMVVWNSRKFLHNDTFLLIGISFLFVGILDLLHTLAYTGMGVFHGFNANPPTQLWIAACYVQSISLAAAPLLIERNPISSKPAGIPLTLAGYLTAFGLIVASIFFVPVFPACYVEGVGLTPFKKVSEYVVCSLLAVSRVLLPRRRRYFDANLLWLLTASIVLTILSELCFTLYISVYGAVNFVGHIFKLAAMFLIYTAVIEFGGGLQSQHLPGMRGAALSGLCQEKAGELV